MRLCLLLPATVLPDQGNNPYSQSDANSGHTAIDFRYRWSYSCVDSAGQQGQEPDLWERRYQFFHLQAPLNKKLLFLITVLKC